MRIVRDLRKWTGKTHERSLQLLRMFEGRRLDGLDPWGYVDALSNVEDLSWQLPRRFCLTIQAKLAAQNAPKAKFKVSDADWSVKRRAKRLDRYVEAQMAQRQKQYESGRDLTLDVLLDALIWGRGAVAVIADTYAKRIRLERVYPFDLLVDPRESRAGTVNNLFRVASWDRDLLAARYPEKESAIASAREDELAYVAGAAKRGRNDVSDQCMVVEAWRLPFGDKPGRHVVAVDNALLEDEEWTDHDFPIAIMRWNRHRMGWDASGAIEDIEGVVSETQTTIERIREAERLNAPVVIVEDDAVDEDDLTSNENWQTIRHRKGTPAPQYIAPEAYSQSTIAWLNMNMLQAEKILGVNEMSVSAQRPAGIDSAIGLRTLNDMQSERLSMPTRQFEQLHVTLARLIISATRRVAEVDPEFSVKWPGSQFLREIRWEDVSLDEEMYEIAVEPMSSLSNTYAGRVSTAQDLFNAGVIGADAFLRIVNLGDLDREVSMLQAQYEYLEDSIEHMLDATLEDVESGKYKPDQPEPFLVPELAIAQVGQEYLRAKMQRAPVWNLSLLLDYIKGLDVMLQRKQQAMAAMAGGGAPAAGAPDVTPQVAPTAATPMAARQAA